MDSTYTFEGVFVSSNNFGRKNKNMANKPPTFATEGFTTCRELENEGCYGSLVFLRVRELTGLPGSGVVNGSSRSSAVSNTGDAFGKNTALLCILISLCRPLILASTVAPPVSRRQVASSDGLS